MATALATERVNDELTAYGMARSTCRACLLPPRNSARQRPTGEPAIISALA